MRGQCTGHPGGGPDVIRSVFAAPSAAAKDQRDREINRLGDHIAQSFLIIGAVTALCFAMIDVAMIDVALFWITNAIYLGFVLSAILGSIAKIIACRRGF